MGAFLQPSGQEALEVFLGKLTEHAFSGLLLLDQRGAILRASLSAKHLLGRQVEEVEGSDCFEFVHPGDLDLARMRLAEAVTKPGVAIHDTLRVRHKGGDWAYVEAVGVNRLDDPDVQAVVVTYRDVTRLHDLEDQLRAHRRAQAAMRRSAAELVDTVHPREIAQRIVSTVKSVFEASAAWVGEAAPDGSITLLAASDAFSDYVATAAVRWDDTPRGHGPTGTAIRSRKPVVCETIEEERYAPWRDLAASRGLACSAAFPLTSRNGTFGALNLYSDRAGFFTADTLELIEVFARQAGLALENARLFTSLRESEQRFRGLFEESRDAIFLAANGRLQDANPAMLELFGIDREALDSTDTARIFADPADRDRLAAAIAAHGAVRDFEARLKRADGAVLDALITATARRDGGGRVYGLQGIIRDVTERKQMEERIRASQRLEAVGRLAGGVAHDYNNSLTAILGFTGLLEQRLAGDPEALTDLREVRAAAQRAAELTRQLLAFSRRQVLQPAQVDLNRTLSGMERLLRHMVGEDVQFALTLGAEPMTVTVDPTQLEQVILNLVVNARQAMPEGGILTISTAQRDLGAPTAFEGATLPPGRYVALTVRDTGAGIPPDARAHLFEPFFTTKKTGTGLGLATVYGIVSQSAGQIAVESEPHRGTTFTVVLPSAERAETSRAAPTPAATASGSETVLVVDDQPAVLNVARHILERSGYRVISAGDAESALAALRGNADSVALVLTDLVLPGVGGREIARRLREILPGLRVLFMSGYADASTMVRFPSDPGTAFLAKPFTTSQLCAAVRQLLDAPAS